MAVETLRQYSAPALEKGIDVVELLDGAHAPMGLSEIAAALKRSKSEMFRVLRVLESRGYIERPLPSDRYRLTNKLFVTGLRQPPVAELLDVAYPEMRQLAAAIRQSCHLSVLSGERMITVARVEGPGEVSFMLRVGYGVSVALSASGRVYLALLPEAQRQRWVTRLRRKGLAERLALIRRRGYELAPSPVVAGVTDVSFPLTDTDGAVVACLAAPLVRRLGEPDDRAGILAALGAAAGRISASLRTAPGDPAKM
ncbi:MAG: helix-turn-helix domain-containing protein [Alphaproteobacteria bacterium]|nr:helix-turn-helix domain-containing protein [Alphaproteobacteria bacterium]